MAADERKTPEILDAREAGDYLRLNEQTVRRLARQADLPSFKVGGSWRFRKTALDRWVADQEQASGIRRIIVVEAGEPMRTLLQRTLERTGYGLEIVSHLLDIEELLTRGRPDLLMLNPGVPSISASEMMQSVRHGWGSIPVVIITEGDDPKLLPVLVRYSPVTLLACPATPQQILKSVGEAIPRG